jgi:hypothetical protein
VTKPGGKREVDVKLGLSRERILSGMTDKLKNISDDDLQKILEHEREIRERLDHPASGLHDYYGLFVVGHAGLRYWITYGNLFLNGVKKDERNFVDKTIIKFAREELGMKNIGKEKTRDHYGAEIRKNERWYEG